MDYHYKLSLIVLKVHDIVIVPKEHPEMFRVLFYLLTTSEGCVSGFLPFLGARAGSSV